MKSVYKIGNALALAGLVFLLFIFLFDNKLVIPAWVQVFGRMHPLVLHFPIVLLLLSMVCYWLPLERSTAIGWPFIRLIAALTALITAIMGMLLSIEQADKGDVLTWHKWSGISMAIIAWAMYQFHDLLNKDFRYGKIAAGFGCIILVLTGHWGADLTHGDNYLFAPITHTPAKTIDINKAELYADIIQPIFTEKCANCHLNHNQKGGLSLNDSLSIFKGGKNGKALVPGDVLKSLVIERIHLPLSDKKHMPLSDKPQLTNEEIQLLEQWIKSGAAFNKKLLSLPEKDSLRILAINYIQPLINKQTNEVYDFSAASSSKIKDLNNNYRIVKPLGANSPALSVSFFGKLIYSTETLKELNSVKEQILHLNLSKMPVTDEQVNWIAGLPNLRKLNLNYSDITDKSMAQISGMKNLETLSLAGTKITKQGIETVLLNKHLKEVFVWDSKMSATEMALLQQKNPQLIIEQGFQGADTTVVALNAPIINTTSAFFTGSKQIILSHVIKGVEIRYTINGKTADSNSTVYTGPFTISNTCSIKVRANKKGWDSSSTVSAVYTKAGFPIVNVEYLTPPDSKYAAGASKLLNDLDLADPRDFSTNWVGFQKNDAIIVFDLGETKPVSEVKVNSLYFLRSFVFPPVFLTVWGSNDNKNWKELKTIVPEQPQKLILRREGDLLSLKFNTTQVRYLKLQGKPVKKIPSWHPGKGQPGWFFLNEVIVY